MPRSVPTPPPLPPGVASARDEEGLPVFPTYGDPGLAAVDFAVAYAHLVAVTAARVEFLGSLLALQYEREGVAGLVGEEYAVAVEQHGDSSVAERVLTGKEQSRVLVELEAAERDRLHKYLRDGIRIGLEARQVDQLKRVGQWMAGAMRSLAGELGLDWSDASVRRAAQRAVLAARASMGAEGGVGSDASSAGPPLSREERTRVLGHRSS